MTKVVTFGAFVEILPGVEGLVHISELAPYHVENPREIVSQGEVAHVKVIEMDADRRRLSLSLKRVEEGEVPRPRPEGAPQLGLSEEVFADERGAPAGDELEAGADLEVEPEVESAPEPESAAAPEVEPEAEQVAPEAVAEADQALEAEASGEEAQAESGPASDADPARETA